MSTRTWFEDFYSFFKSVWFSFEFSNLRRCGNHLAKNSGMFYYKDFIFVVIRSSRSERLNDLNFYQKLCFSFFYSTFWELF